MWKQLVWSGWTDFFLKQRSWKCVVVLSGSNKQRVIISFGNGITQFEGTHFGQEWIKQVQPSNREMSTERIQAYPHSISLHSYYHNNKQCSQEQPSQLPPFLPYSPFHTCAFRLFSIFSIEVQSKMGVCMSACAKVPNHPNTEIRPIEHDQIAKQIQTPNHQAHPDGAARTPSIKEEFSQEEEQQEESKKPSQMRSRESIHSQKTEEEAAAIGDPQEEGEKEVSKYFIGRGKSTHDNQLIRQVISAQGKIKMPRIQLDNGVAYEGEWQGGQREGQGEQVWADGSRYVGEWRGNQANGRGILYHSDGDVYQGEWLNDKASGQGTYTHANGACYVGEWLEDKQHGHGKQSWPDGEVYQGEYRAGCKHGQGVLRFMDQSYYSGQFCANQIHGKGVYVWHNNKKYEGQWQHNKMSGYGITTWVDGRVYEGEYLEDKKHGFGTFTWPDGRKYKGNWQQGKQHGRGEYFMPNGESKIGEWVNGKKIRWINDKDTAGES